MESSPDNHAINRAWIMLPAGYADYYNHHVDWTSGGQASIQPKFTFHSPSHTINNNAFDADPDGSVISSGYDYVGRGSCGKNHSPDIINLIRGFNVGNDGYIHDYGSNSVDFDSCGINSPVTHSDNTEYGAYPNGDVNDYGAVRGSSGGALRSQSATLRILRTRMVTPHTLTAQAVRIGVTAG